VRTWSPTGYEPYLCCLAFGLAAEKNKNIIHHRQGGAGNLLPLLRFLNSDYQSPSGWLVDSSILRFPPNLLRGNSCKMVESTHNTLPYPPQMRNGGSSLAHLSTSSLSDPSWWLQFKWSQPPPRAPEWLFDYYKSYNPPAPLKTPKHISFQFFYSVDKI
jgi:hypothetical protein